MNEYMNMVDNINNSNGKAQNDQSQLDLDKCSLVSITQFTDGTVFGDSDYFA